MRLSDITKKLSIRFKAYANIRGTHSVPEINAKIGYHSANEYNPVALNLGDITFLDSFYKHRG